MTTQHILRVPGAQIRATEPLRVILITSSVFGGTGVGKTSVWKDNTDPQPLSNSQSLVIPKFVNDASGSNLQIGHDLPSCTKAVQAGPVFFINDRAVQIFDTPGFDDTTLTDTEILRSISEFLLRLHVQNQPITGVVYIHRITDIRMNGASVRALSLFQKICGSQAMRNAVIVTNMWSIPRDPQQEVRENQLKSEYFRSAILDGAKVARRGGTGPERTAIRQLPLDETEAGALVDQNLRKRLERQQREKMELEEELQEAIRERDRRAQEQLGRFKRDKELEVKLLQEQLDALREASDLQRQSVSLSRRHEVQHPGGTGSPPGVHSSVGTGGQSSNRPGRGFGLWKRGNRNTP
ncbi:50S ribosome-binding GTPase [Rhizoctonia solani]|uniref:50S ribosome-binding GTPase n=1 Tax=Rhizoctonia solani TaxID=456999 RepID=A0A8H7HZU5_9AGAM|nr:50S ribosome-binding GTPase [Rhizoctonia solani]